jgi:hypothetical protein
MKLQRQVIVALPDEHTIFRVHYKRAPLSDVADIRGRKSELIAAEDNLRSIDGGEGDKLDGAAVEAAEDGISLAMDLYAKTLPKLIKRIDSADMTEAMIEALEEEEQRAQAAAESKQSQLRAAALEKATTEEERDAALSIEVDPEEVDPRRVLDFRECAKLDFDEELFEIEIEREGEAPVEREITWREMSRPERLATLDAYMHLGEVLLPAVLDQDNPQILGKLRPRRSLAGGRRR